VCVPIKNVIIKVLYLGTPIDVLVMKLQDGRISYDEFATMMKAGTDWRKASRQYSRERFASLSLTLMRDGSLHLNNEKNEGR